MNTVVVDYNAGNITSVMNALKRLGVEGILTRDGNELSKASRVIIPGVGHAATAMASLRQLALEQSIRNLKCPVLGICLGMQLMFSRSGEGGDTECLGLVSGSIERLSSEKKVPHIGWNQVKVSKDFELFGNLESAYFYFVHSFRAPIKKDYDSCATTVYGSEVFTSAFKLGNFYGVQFHPERSGEAGAKLLQNFLLL